MQKFVKTPNASTNSRITSVKRNTNDTIDSKEENFRGISDFADSPMDKPGYNKTQMAPDPGGTRSVEEICRLANSGIWDLENPINIPIFKFDIFNIPPNDITPDHKKEIEKFHLYNKIAATNRRLKSAYQGLEREKTPELKIVHEKRINDARKLLLQDKNKFISLGGEAPLRHAKHDVGCSAPLGGQDLSEPGKGVVRSNSLPKEGKEEQVSPSKVSPDINKPKTKIIKRPIPSPPRTKKIIRRGKVVEEKSCERVRKPTEVEPVKERIVSPELGV